MIIRGGFPLPRILITTSRRPSPRVRSLVKDLAQTLPGGERLTRGHLSMKELAVEARLTGADRVVIIGERRGNPGIMRIYRPAGETLINIVSFIIKGVKLGREAGHGYPSERGRLIVEAEGSRVADEFADAMVTAFHARVFEEPSENDVVAVIRGLDERTVLVSFRWRDREVGPVLRLGKPAIMVKHVEGSL